MINTGSANESRRDVQRRFMPGTLAVCHRSSRLMTVIGWSPTPAEPGYEPKLPANTHQHRMPKAASWESVVIMDNRITCFSWQVMRANWTLEEWTDDAT